MLESVLSSGPSRRLLDLGCGTGEHARFLVSRGFEVVAVDASESMLSTAFQGPAVEGLHFLGGDIREIGTLVEGGFGGAICLGNTLPHLRGESDLSKLFDGLRRRLLPGAPLLLQLLNYERIFRRRQRHLPLNFVDDGGEEILFLRLMKLRENGEVLFFPSTLRLVPDGDPPLRLQASKRVRLRGWRAAEIESALQSSGFGERRLLGSFNRDPFAPLKSADLIVIAR